MTCVDLVGKVVFVVGTGRCGTHFIANVIGRYPKISTTHERNRLNESFHRYCKWYNLPVDDEGFLCEKEKEIRSDLVDYEISFEASSYLALSISELYNRFNSKFILLVRNPERVVNSFVYKGQGRNDVVQWYATPYVVKDQNLAMGYQVSTRPHHFFGRIAPIGESFLQWNQLTRVGKLAWYWNAINSSAIEQLKKIPKSNWRVVKIEDFDYDHFLEIGLFLGCSSSPKISKIEYDELVQNPPDSYSHIPKLNNWTNLEMSEFEIQVGQMAQYFQYSHQIQNR